MRCLTAAPSGKPRGAVVVLQEIFGVNRSIRAVADRYAAEGYTAETVQEGLGYMMQVGKEQFLADTGAAVNAVKGSGKVGVVGFCWGGTIAYVAACRLPVAAAASYYGSSIPKFLDEAPRCPVLYHFGGQDPSIPPATVESIRAAHPAGVFHVYPADHAFANADRPQFHAPSAQLALERTLAFFAGHVG